ncbi:hypothetical protein [Butyrivibrio fibrisolvens]|uniref:hypothetical protein n=1 Tax=Butyrivibrio fibrisolvens TaxID=831 RepID=UPI0003B38297|nr:hypothetical protein [Butyrivibrio fibrisolvens]
MKNSLFKCISTITAIFLLATSMTFTSRAELAQHYDNTEDFYLTSYNMYIEQGGYDSVGVHATNTVSYYIIGAYSSNTYVILKESGAGFDLEVHVGKDETAHEFTVYIYLDGTTDYHKDLYVGVKDVFIYNPDSELDTASLIDSIPVAYLNSNVGNLILVNDYKNGFFYTADGLPIAQFSVYSDNGQIRVLQLGQSFSTENGLYIEVNTTTNGTIRISESDKIALQLFGVNGLILNGTITPWP